MHDLNVFGEQRIKVNVEHISSKYIQMASIDALQHVVNSFIVNANFPWLCLVLLLNKGDWKRTVIMILISHWFLRSIGDVLKHIMKFYPPDPNMEWPYHLESWYVSNSFARVFWFAGEIIGDWYPLIRTKAIIKNKRKIKPVYITCFIYNIVKIVGVACDFVYAPKDLNKPQEKFEINKYVLDYKVHWWVIVMVTQVASFFYDMSVIIALKNSLFNKLKSLTLNSKKNRFIDKFKQISELRIFISMIISFLFLPFALYLVSFLIYNYYYVINYKATFDIHSINDKIEKLRQLVLNFNYTFMYIDQVLLRFYMNQNNSNHSASMKSYQSFEPRFNQSLFNNEKENHLLQCHSNNPIFNLNNNIFQNNYNYYHLHDPSNVSNNNPNELQFHKPIHFLKV
ncbi:hypothetical protein BCR36DRAFT_371709 [Piromyces finnis]|uniref:G-protein coupled receptors family 1 profile domain-containing protein n=1 Tax=Piromyces finnis TaxID=1754191 RepID=A0A1Y1V5D4_9FUNG|nr:hypothetical protein BCR36DRAFT_371709 [Piromyces finnis]|eukprot:ORX47642.1 hypothetical protein BCR36DRAFT_371709 [Piromyces finnis]